MGLAALVVNEARQTMQDENDNYVTLVENGGIWEYSNLWVGEDGYVEGSAYTREKNGHDIQVVVTSYEYETRGETRMNHVPNVVVTDKTGRIVAEPHAWDDKNPKTAIKSAIGTAESVFEGLEQFIQRERTETDQ
jgi:diphthamide synthase (EF-2-diphthine--ammonia ligase)